MMHVRLLSSSFFSNVDDDQHQPSLACHHTQPSYGFCGDVYVAQEANRELPMARKVQLAARVWTHLVSLFIV
jgi:hypothetical protein